MLLTQFIQQNEDKVLVVNHRTEVFDQDMVDAFRLMIAEARKRKPEPGSHTAIMVPALGIVMIPVFDRNSFAIALANNPKGCSVMMTCGTCNDQERWDQFRKHANHRAPKVWSWCVMEGTDKDTLLKLIRHAPQIAASQLESNGA
jgi:hypothetical protein